MALNIFVCFMHWKASPTVQCEPGMPVCFCARLVHLFARVVLLWVAGRSVSVKLASMSLYPTNHRTIIGTKYQQVLS